jgi:hypothetical protein
MVEMLESPLLLWRDDGRGGGDGRAAQMADPTPDERAGVWNREPSAFPDKRRSEAAANVKTIKRSVWGRP